MSFPQSLSKPKSRSAFVNSSAVPEPNLQKAIEERFALAKATAYFEGAFARCGVGKCRRRRTCCGGPRGTMKRSGGVPVCQVGKCANLQESAP